MYKPFARWVERVLKIPPRPEPPPGDESATRIFRAAPRYYQYRLVLWALVHGPIGLLLALGFGIGFFAASRESGGVAAGIGFIALLVLGFFALLAAFNYACLRLDYENRWYVVTDRSLRIREGVVHVREMTVTFANIQNISVEQGPLQRLLKIADLKVDTAGGGGGHQGQHAGANLHTARFGGIDNAPEIKEMIQRRLRGLKDAGLGDLDDRHAELAAPSGDLDEALRGLLDEVRALKGAAMRVSHTVAVGAGR